MCVSDDDVVLHACAPRSTKSSAKIGLRLQAGACEGAEPRPTSAIIGCHARTQKETSCATNLPAAASGQILEPHHSVALVATWHTWAAAALLPLCAAALRCGLRVTVPGEVVGARKSPSEMPATPKQRHPKERPLLDLPLGRAPSSRPCHPGPEHPANRANLVLTGGKFTVENESVRTILSTRMDWAAAHAEAPGRHTPLLLVFLDDRV